MKLLVFLFLLNGGVIASSYVSAQSEAGPIRLWVGPDGIATSYLPPVEIIARAPTEAERRAYLQRLKKYEKLRYNLKVVYPLAKECSRLLNETNDKLATMRSEKEKEKYLKQLEKELFQKYEKKIYDLTLSQGKLLIKLIHRETSNSAFQLIRDYRNWGTAAFWQVIARFLGANLKEVYNREEEQVIEYLIYQLESGKSDEYTVIYQ
ncbi:MAG: DUF4294 domain-containing protein [Bacteroidia bacterium]|nr:DUF4294 domain-containing protein [Bacteroidia bacterium]MDW8158273.1 DUF4294 domain-containing protein [Bacteroidia bacterium]